ncbi:MAG: flagellar protein FlaG [Alphaproteobacteria bacterium]
MDITNATAAVSVPRVEPHRDTTAQTQLIAPKVAAVVEAKAAEVQSRSETEIAAVHFRQALQEQDTRLQLDIDRGTGQVVGRIINAETGKVVNQIPSEEMIRLLARTREFLGTFLDRKA